MEWIKILHRIREGEGDRTEFKRGLGRDLSSVGKAICAFANSDGGVLILGISDSGEIIGVTENSERVQERLTSFLQSGLSAPVPARCGRHDAQGGWVHWIDVRRERGLEPLRHNGKVWVRRARSSVEPSPSELQELYNAFGFVLTENQVIRRAGPDAIDIDLFRSFQRDRGIDIDSPPQVALESDLLNQQVLSDDDGQLCPTLYGLLLFGRDPQGHPHTTNFFVRCACYRGDDQASSVLSVADARATVVDQVRRSVGWFRSLGGSERYPSPFREDRPLLPERALREAIVNAVIHRDYAVTGSTVLLEVFRQRVVITSPGVLPNHMTVERARGGGGPRSRNELVANAMVVRRLMEQRGRGWPLMRRAMFEFNGTEPELENDTDNRLVRVTFRLGKEAETSAP